MSLKTKLIKLIEQPKSILTSSRELMMAKYDLLFASELMKSKFDTFVDVGSAVGEYTYIFKKMFPNSKIYSFEPLHSLYDNKLEDYPAFGIALWNKNQTLDFTIAKDLRMSSIVNKNAGNRTRRVKTKRFDGLNIELQGTSLLKIDVEGAEKEVLEGFGEELKKFEVVILEINMDRCGRVSEILKIMEENGYYKFIQRDLRKSFGQCNLFFIKEKVYKKI